MSLLSEGKVGPMILANDTERETERQRIRIKAQQE